MKLNWKLLLSNKNLWISLASWLIRLEYCGWLSSQDLLLLFFYHSQENKLALPPRAYFTSYGILYSIALFIHIFAYFYDAAIYNGIIITLNFHSARIKKKRMRKLTRKKNHFIFLEQIFLQVFRGGKKVMVDEAESGGRKQARMWSR